MPQSPYIDRLKVAIAQATDSWVRGERRAELAAALARLGEFDAAEAEIADVRAEFGDGRSGRVSILVMCAEAQVIYYKNLGEAARDRMLRAQLLSVAGKDAKLSALTSAWLAHIQFNLHRHDEMARSLKTALDMVTAGDHEAASRLALTLGDSFSAAEQPEVARLWYSKAHDQAVKLGDHSTIGALTYNRAAMGTFMARVQATRGQVDESYVSRLVSEVRTAVNYQAIAQLASLQVLLDYTMASANMLASKYSEAGETLAKIVSANPSTSPIERSVVLKCDLAQCLARSGRVHEALALLESVGIDDVLACTADDQVVALGALADAAQICGLHERADDASSKLTAASQEHAAAAAKLRSTLLLFSAPEMLSRI